MQYNHAVSAASPVQPRAAAHDTTDDALVAQIAQRDKRALQSLYARHHVRVYRFALRFLNDEAAAEDTVSEVFIDVWRQAERFEGRSQVTTWLLAIARNKALSAMRRRIDAPLDAAMDIADQAATAEETSDAGKRSATLRACLEQLSPSHREIIDLVYYHEQSVDEVSTILGVPAATVKTRMFYARKRLAELVKAAGIERARY